LFKRRAILAPHGFFGQSAKKMFKKILLQRGRRRLSRFGTASFKCRVHHPATLCGMDTMRINYRGARRSVNDFFVEV
jgi:hypothetical protein